MAEGYDNTNSGALHAPRTEKLIRSGTVDIDGTGTNGYCAVHHPGQANRW